MLAATASEIKTIEQRAIRSGIPSLALMERAGRAAAEEALAMLSGTCGCVVSVCGRGNNGGDGLVAARMLHTRGIPVVCLLTGNGRMSDETSYQLGEYLRAGGKADDFKGTLPDCSLIIDAIFGTGLKRPAEGIHADSIRAINQSAAKKLSIDLPSGIFCDGETLAEPAVRADRTITFTLPRPAHFLSPFYSYCGTVTVADIGIPPEHIAAGRIRTEIFDAALAARLLPKRPFESNKSDYGRLLLVCGAQGYTGAPVLAAEAAVRSGAGLVFLGVPESIYTVVASRLTEAMPFPLADEQELLHRADTADVCLAGCGMGRSQRTQQFVFALLAQFLKPLVLDADGINALCGHINRLHDRGAPVILTPHDGELARLLQRPVTENGESRLEAARRISRELGAVLVMKGHRTITASPNGRAIINTTGNAGMARGGSGDLLAGLIAAFACRLPDPLDAAALGVYLHGRAGDLSAGELGKDGMTPSDMLKKLPAALSEIERSPPSSENCVSALRPSH